MAKAFLLSETTKREIQDSLDKAKHVRGNTSQRGRDGRVDHEEQQAPETYIAKTPVEGIDGMDLESAEPGFADCDIYRNTAISEETYQLMPVSTLKRRVFNLSTATVQGDRFVVITRDKWGSWLVWPEIDCPRSVRILYDIFCEDGNLRKVYKYLFIIHGCPYLSNFPLEELDPALSSLD